MFQFRSLMQLTSLFTCMSSAAVLASANIAFSQVWKAHESRTPQGLHALSLLVQQHEFALQLTCDETGQETDRMKVMFFGPTLPRLYGTDGQTETLLLHFGQAAEATKPFVWKVHYFDGGVGDQAWIGDIAVTERFLQEFSKAADIDILNSDLDLVYRFPAKGTALGVDDIRQVCGVGSG